MRQGWLIALVVFCVSGCAKEKEKGSGWQSFPIAVYTDSFLADDTAARQDFYAAMDFWETSAGRKLFDYKGAWTGSAPFKGNPERPEAILANVVLFQNPWPFGAHEAGMTVVLSTEEGTQGSIVMLNPGIPLCAGDCAGERFRTSQQRLIAHELGHFIGLSHSQEAGNVMYPSLEPGGSLQASSIDRAALAQATATGR